MLHNVFEQHGSPVALGILNATKQPSEPPTTTGSWVQVDMDISSFGGCGAIPPGIPGPTNWGRQVKQGGRRAGNHAAHPVTSLKIHVTRRSIGLVTDSSTYQGLIRMS
mmetsp:Transcript_57624/g.102952  ORF Transcript_57624/g.102952 Transcript_57624/m.102952 type:complete len:108 (-) Transcript_57624:70-393(-)